MTKKQKRVDLPNRQNSGKTPKTGILRLKLPKHIRQIPLLGTFKKNTNINMNKNTNICLRCPAWGKSVLVFLIVFCGLRIEFKLTDVEAQELTQIQEPQLVQSVFENADGPFVTDGNSVVAVSENTTKPSLEEPKESKEKETQRMNVVVTAYSSTIWETDDTPYITASGEEVSDGIVANNFLSFGTKMRIPEIFGDKVFTVEDRMHWRKSDYQIDIWFPDTDKALNFGVRNTYIEIFEAI